MSNVVATTEKAEDIVVGIDISKWQWGRPIPWKELRSRGVRFCICKATHGQSSIDPYFREGYRQAREEGFIRGAYLWFLPSQDVRAQALHAADIIGSVTGPGDLPASIDHEDTTTVLRGQAITDKLEELIGEFEPLTGRHSPVYTGSWYTDLTAKGVPSTRIGSRPLWLSAYPKIDVPDTAYMEAARIARTKTPRVPHYWFDMGRRELFFQFDGDGGLRFPNGTDADFNIFRGSFEALQCFANERIEQPVPTLLGGVVASEEKTIDEQQQALVRKVLASISGEDPSNVLVDTVSEALARDAHARSLVPTHALLKDKTLMALLSRSDRQRV